MRRYLVNRLLQAIPVLFILSVVIFGLVRILPDDPIYAMLGEDAGGFTPEQRAALEQELGLDRALPVQYFNWITGFMRGDWGVSFQNKRPVTQEIMSRLPYTLELAFGAFLLAVTVGVSAGVVAALKRNSILDMIATSGAMFGIAVPPFWFALIMILVFGVTLDLVPVYGAELVWEEPLKGLHHLILPSIALGLAQAATLMRQTRSSMLEVMGEDYIRTARAKGMRERRVIWSDALRNSLLPVVTILGIRLGRVIGGTVIIEVMFSWPGLGRLAVFSLQKADYPVIQAIVVLSGVFIIFANLLTDITYAYLDPRIRYG